MKVQYLSSDKISTLPQDVIGRILCDLPIKDALRTSILSSKWRYSWRSIPRLQFDDRSFKVSCNIMQLKKYKFVNALLQILLLHKGPLLHFGLCIDELNIASEIDPLIVYLSMSNTLERFELANGFDHRYKLPFSFFSFKRLEELFLEGCVVKPPLTFNGFSRLRYLCLDHCYDASTSSHQLSAT